MTTDLIKLEVITPETEAFLAGVIDDKLTIQETNEFGTGRGRDVLRFGFSYGEKEEFLCAVPDWIVNNCYPVLLPFVPDSVTINRYPAGVGIKPHIDSMDFGSPIMILSLSSCATMLLHPPSGKPLKLFVPRRSLTSLAGRFRSEYQHSITFERYDTDHLGMRHQRRTRFSIVLRKRVLK